MSTLKCIDQPNKGILTPETPLPPPTLGPATDKETKKIVIAKHTMYIHRLSIPVLKIAVLTVHIFQ